MKKGSTLLLFLGIAQLILLESAQAQEKYPNRTVEMVVPAGMGGAVDIGARIFNEKLSQILKVPVNVVNRTGGAGITGTNYVATAKKDGYTLLYGAAPQIVILPIVSTDVPYNSIKDFAPLAQFGYVPSVIAVKSDSRFKTLAELIEFARKNPEKLKSASSGTISTSTFNLLVLCSKNNIKITPISFEGGGEALVAILGGHVDLAANTLAPLAPQIKAGKLRGLAITSLNRHPDFPDIPTTTELGYPYLNFNLWEGVLAPAGTPESILKILVQALESVFKNPEVVQSADKAGMTVDYKGPKEFQQFIETEFQVLERVAKDAGLSKK